MIFNIEKRNRRYIPTSTKHDKEREKEEYYRTTKKRHSVQLTQPVVSAVREKDHFYL